MPSYPSFAALQKNEVLGVDYRIRVRRGLSGIAIMAIHGGGIEPGTTEVADAVAGQWHTFYTFSGLKPSGNAGLHISSRKFDEPVGRFIAQNSRTVVTIHGCRDESLATYVGGRHAAMKKAIRAALASAGFTATDARRFPGINPKNICNRGRLGMGVQLEIPIAMRKLLFEDISRLYRKRGRPCFSAYVRAVQLGINRSCPTHPPWGQSGHPRLFPV
ncbi:hypothetical protein DSCW_25000 [Desulfosarcina widdelii]|uniref:Replication protein n=1 Tax=Desulfosarcina widdelii TaxID=947919 RepID=A0A5K7Z590_9BACT|nr:poly-gamma-glutamate hydrolase family protein [Desulfosarcina widdelii]BBO75083.1 hypothetical protein DSCW_25000 [Desulfosarcina widdelii]